MLGDAFGASLLQPKGPRTPAEPEGYWLHNPITGIYLELVWGNLNVQEGLQNQCSGLPDGPLS